MARPALAQRQFDVSELGYADDTAQGATDSFVRAWHAGDWIIVYALLADDTRAAFVDDVAGRQLHPWYRPVAMDGAPGGSSVTGALSDIFDATIELAPDRVDDPIAFAILFAGVFSTLDSTGRLPFDFIQDALVDIDLAASGGLGARVTSGTDRFAVRLDNADGDWRIVQVAPIEGDWRWPDHSLNVDVQ